MKHYANAHVEHFAFNFAEFHVTKDAIYPGRRLADYVLDECSKARSWRETLLNLPDVYLISHPCWDDSGFDSVTLSVAKPEHAKPVGKMVPDQTIEIVRAAMPGLRVHASPVFVTSDYRALALWRMSRDELADLYAWLERQLVYPEPGVDPMTSWHVSWVHVVGGML